MARIAGRLACIMAAGLLLAGCADGMPSPAASDASGPTGTNAPASAPLDCSGFAARWVEGDLPPEFYDGVTGDVQIVGTNSGTVLQSPDVVYQPESSASASATEDPKRVEPDPDWPEDAVVYLEPGSGDVVKTIKVPKNLVCTP